MPLQKFQHSLKRKLSVRLGFNNPLVNEVIPLPIAPILELVRIFELDISNMVDNTGFTISIKDALPVCNKMLSEQFILCHFNNRKQFVASLWNIFKGTILASRAKSIFPRDIIRYLGISPTAFDGSILIDLHLVEFGFHQFNLFLKWFRLGFLLVTYAIIFDRAMNFFNALSLVSSSMTPSSPCDFAMSSQGTDAILQTQAAMLDKFDSCLKQLNFG